jgi:hypothetical protein
MKTKYIILLTAIVLASGSLALVGTSQSPPLEPLIGETIITRPAHATKTKLGSFDDRNNLDPKESITVDLKLNRHKGKIRIDAPNGGSINRKRGGTEIDVPPAGQSAHVDFSVGASPGRYTLEVSQANVTETLEFWVGPEPPSGRPGPKLTFTGGN